MNVDRSVSQLATEVAHQTSFDVIFNQLVAELIK
jgi:hypothetical protein